MFFPDVEPAKHVSPKAVQTSLAPLSQAPIHDDTIVTNQNPNESLKIQEGPLVNINSLPRDSAQSGELDNISEKSLDKPELKVENIS